ncbi:MAG: hypothetical protein AAF941_09460 [Pseudomonadota bacterium]
MHTEPEALTYYGSMACSAESCPKDNDVSLVLGVATPAPKPLRFTTLDPKVQAALIEASDQEQRVALLRNTPFSGSSSNVDNSRVKQTREVTLALVESPQMHPANRVQSATLNLAAPKDWEIKSLSDFVDVNTTIAVGSITDSATASFSSNLGVTAPLTAGLAASNEETSSATQQITRSITATQYTVTGNVVTIPIRAPLPQITASRTYKFKIAMEYAGEKVGVPISKFRIGDSKIPLDQSVEVYPHEEPGSLVASGRYTLRQVARSTPSNLNEESVRSIKEGDDIVTLIEGTLSGELEKPLFRDASSSLVYLEYDGKPVRIATPTSRVPFCVFLPSPPEAFALVNWMKRAKKSQGDGWKLVDPAGNPIPDNSAAGITVRNGHTEMKAQDVAHVWQIAELRGCSFPFRE